MPIRDYALEINMKKKEKVLAIVLAAGKGSRMGGEIPKQYMEVAGKPLFMYSLMAMEEADIDEVFLITALGDERYCRECVEEFGLKKVVKYIAGGKERYHSVYNGLKAGIDGEYTVVLIHDSARPMIDREYINRVIMDTKEYGGSILTVPVKDTIKTVSEGFIHKTLERNQLVLVQTPQGFAYDILYKAYQKLMSKKEYQQGITDDAMVVEMMLGMKVKSTMGFYENIKVTTKEDIVLVEILQSLKKVERE